jgi:hypothetical protein
MVVMPRRLHLVSPALALWALGCFLDRSVANIGDGGGNAGFDARTPVRDGGVDAQRDTGPRDAGLPSCDDQYGTAAGYRLCGERATECEFVALLDGVRSCGSTCDALGGHCIDAYANEEPFDTCKRIGPALGCNIVHVNDICICSRGP